MNAPARNTEDVGRAFDEFMEAFDEFKAANAPRHALSLAETLVVASGDIKAAADSIVSGYRYMLPISTRACADAKSAAQRVLDAITEYEHQIETMTEEA